MPDQVRGEHALLMIFHQPNAERSDHLPPETHTRVWLDSIVLDRVWTLQVHSSRLVDGTPAWKERRAQREAEVARWYASAVQKAIVPPEMLLSTRAIMLNDSTLRSTDAPHQMPNVEVNSRGAWGGGGRASGFVFMVVGSAVAMWAVIFAVSGRILKRSESFGRASVLLVAAVASIAILLGLQNSGDDPAPSYLLGKIAGMMLVLLLPVAVAIVIERHRRRRDSYAVAPGKR